MKMMAAWLESAIANVEVKKKNSTLYLVILSVFILGALSLYILLNSTA